MVSGSGIGLGLILARNTAYLNDLLLEISQIDISVDEDMCTWVLSNDGTFSVKSVRRLIDSKLLPSILTPTMWDKFLPRNLVDGCDDVGEGWRWRGDLGVGVEEMGVT
nr:hypothetical protein [Tanacetum cinerariifolium]